MKRYYWLKLKDDFFTQKAIKKLRKIAGGDTFTIIYLKMMLLAMKSDGKIYYEGIENSFYEELALELDEEEENVQLTVSYLLNHKLMEEAQNEYFLPESICNTGSETDSAERVRRLRQKTLQCNDKALQSNSVVTTCNVEKEKEKEKEIEIEKDIYSQEVAEIIDYLNMKTNSNYRKIDKHIKHISARLKEGYTLQDFYNVIDKKSQEWTGTEYEKFLRPETLFGTKFDGYLNQKVTDTNKEEFTALMQRYQDEERRLS
jgi:uncharacterized phage protein (TIGR02220 family)/predicted phage replisome organizer